MLRFFHLLALVGTSLPVNCNCFSYRHWDHYPFLLITVIAPYISRGQEKGTCGSGISVQDDTGTCTPKHLEDDRIVADGDIEENWDDIEDGLDYYLDEEPSYDSYNNDYMTVFETVEQEVEGSPEEIEGTEVVIRKMEEYFVDEISKSRYDSIRDRCINKDKLCAFWAYTGECERNVEYMHSNCALACRACEQVDQRDGNELNDTDDTMDFGGGTDNVKQEVVGTAEEVQAIEEVIRKMEEYFDDEISKPMYDNIRDQCVNKNKFCALWVSAGECDKNPSFMKLDCSLACQSCDQLDVRFRCPVDPNATYVWKSGDLNKMFENIVSGPDSVFRNVTVLSTPSLVVENDLEYGPRPWVVTIDNFITSFECNRLIELGAQRGYERSKDVGVEKPDGTFTSVESTDRTSSNAWCQDECFMDETVQGVLMKIEALTGIPDTNAEHLQLLKYNEGQFYRTHHDYIHYQRDRPCGPRILTAFLYLNDVDAGGGTNFPHLNLTVMPKQGRLLLWPSVLDSDPFEAEPWTYHQALPVEKGIKYGANGWLHLGDYKTPNSKGCV